MLNWETGFWGLVSGLSLLGAEPLPWQDLPFAFAPLVQAGSANLWPDRSEAEDSGNWRGDGEGLIIGARVGMLGRGFVVRGGSWSGTLGLTAFFWLAGQFIATAT